MIEVTPDWGESADDEVWAAFEAVMAADQPIAAGPRLAPTDEVARPMAVVRAAYVAREVLARGGHDDPALVAAWQAVRRLVMAPGVLTPEGQGAIVALMPAAGPATPRVARIELVACYRLLDGLIAGFSPAERD